VAYARQAIGAATLQRFRIGRPAKKQKCWSRCSKCESDYVSRIYYQLVIWKIAEQLNLLNMSVEDAWENTHRRDGLHVIYRIRAQASRHSCTKESQKATLDKPSLVWNHEEGTILRQNRIGRKKSTKSASRRREVSVWRETFCCVCCVCHQYFLNFGFIWTLGFQ